MFSLRKRLFSSRKRTTAPEKIGLRARIIKPEKRYRLKDGRIVGLFRKNETFRKMETSRERETTMLTLKNEKGKPVCQIGFEIAGKKGLLDYKIKTKGKPFFSLSKEKSYGRMNCAETLLRLSLQEMQKKGVKVVEAPFVPEIGKERFVAAFLRNHGFKEPDKVYLPPLATQHLPKDKLKKFYTGVPIYIIKDLKKLKIQKVRLEAVRT